MPRKEYLLIFQDLAFFLTGKADVARFDTTIHPWGYAPDWEYQLSREETYFAPKDPEGIPLRRYPSLGDQYLMSRIATFGLAHWNRWLKSKSQESRREFLRIADWLLKFPDGRYVHDFAVGGMKPGWISCISQGEAASVLTRAYALTEESKYRLAALASVECFHSNVADGGMLDRFDDGHIFLEEYPGSDIRHVLNGCLYAMIGLHDVIRIAEEPETFQQLFDALTLSVATHLRGWDVNGWSRYDYALDSESHFQNLNTMTYQILQTALLRHLAMVSANPVMAEYAERWDQSSRSFPKRMSAMIQKLAFRLKRGW